MNFDFFQIQKGMSLTIRTQKVDEKWNNLSSFHMFLPELWLLNCQNCAFFATLCRRQQKILIC